MKRRLSVVDLFAAALVLALFETPLAGAVKCNLAPSKGTVNAVTKAEMDAAVGLVISSQDCDATDICLETVNPVNGGQIIYKARCAKSSEACNTLDGPGCLSCDDSATTRGATPPCKYNTHVLTLLKKNLTCPFLKTEKASEHEDTGNYEDVYCPLVYCIAMKYKKTEADPVTVFVGCQADALAKEIRGSLVPCTDTADCKSKINSLEDPKGNQWTKANPGATPVATPGATPGSTPVANPGTNPGANPGATPGGNKESSSTAAATTKPRKNNRRGNTEPSSIAAATTKPKKHLLALFCALALLAMR